ncbi:hypothetical protein RFI_27649 [Reticulomyxa filosa]|uniref:Uncharacterized protein n=1 Tax=Reticulomyxa filosa TaxID=46433 RepID=X6M6W0_RETFI|nr:hypothetical protein RFI_27649 [Reticulomyxa filosa]|eukprot:ETO09728.1 hypothetical protein RFI_27649 [Reticulomyxa filosa]
MLDCQSVNPMSFVMTPLIPSIPLDDMFKSNGSSCASALNSVQSDSNSASATMLPAPSLPSFIPSPIQDSLPSIDKYKADICLPFSFLFFFSPFYFCPYFCFVLFFFFIVFLLLLFSCYFIFRDVHTRAQDMPWWLNYCSKLSCDQCFSKNLSKYLSIYAQDEIRFTNFIRIVRNKFWLVLLDFKNYLFFILLYLSGKGFIVCLKKNSLQSLNKCPKLKHMNQENPVKLIYSCKRYTNKKKLQIVCNGTVFPNVKYFKQLKTNNFKPFPDHKFPLLAVVVMQKTENDMVENSNIINGERDKCLKNFVDFGAFMTKKLISQNKPSPSDQNVSANACSDNNKQLTNDTDDYTFVDVIDPMSGQCLNGTPGPSIYDEVEGGQRLLKFKVTKIRCCGVLNHPDWGSHMYPATIFTNACVDVVKAHILQFLDSFQTSDSIKSSA